MRTLVLVCATAVIGSAALAAQTPPRTGSAIQQLEWMSGSWSGTAGAAVVEEHWSAPLGGSMLAVARTVRGDRLRTFEFLRIVEQEGTLAYVAAPEGRCPPTTFTLTRIDGRSVTFENPSHDFPKVIRYALTAEGTLEATISGANNERAQVFRFRRR